MGLPKTNIEVEADLVVKISEAKGRLSELIARAEAGERVVIARGSEPAIVLTPVRPKKRRLGTLLDLKPGFDVDKLCNELDEPYSDEDLDDFEGELDKELRN